MVTQSKRCTKCGEVKQLDEFYKHKSRKDGRQQPCKSCVSNERREYNKTPKTPAFREKVRARHREYWKDPAFRDRQKARVRERMKDPAYREKKAAWAREHNKNPAVKEKVNAWRRKSRKNPTVRMAQNLRTLCHLVIIKGYKSASTLALLGCTWRQIREYIEAQFVDGMTWDNYGEYWQIDHIIPCAAYDLREPAEQYRCFNYRNIRPLEATANISKNDKLDLDLIQRHGIADLLPAGMAAA